MKCCSGVLEIFYFHVAVAVCDTYLVCVFEMFSKHVRAPTAAVASAGVNTRLMGEIHLSAFHWRLGIPCRGLDNHDD